MNCVKREASIGRTSKATSNEPRLNDVDATTLSTLFDWTSLNLTPLMRRFSFYVVVVALVACADLKEMLSLQQGLAQEFQTQQISININNSVDMTILFSNSPVAQASDSEQAAFARRVGEFVRDHFSKYGGLEAIGVGFSSVRGTGAFHITNTRIPFRFTPQDLGPPRTTTKATTGDKR